MDQTPEMREAVKKYFLQMVSIVKEKGEDMDNLSAEAMKAYEQYWQPFNQVQVDSALRAAKTHEKVVITFAQSNQIIRDYVMSKLKEGAAAKVTMLYLTIDQDTKLEGLYYRSVQQAKSVGVSLSDYCKGFGLDWTEDRDPTLDEFKPLMGAKGKTGNIHFDPPPSYAKVVDVSSRDETSMDVIDAALGLHRASVCTESYDTIVTKVRAIDTHRDEDTPYCWAIFPELEKEITEALASAKTEEEKVQIKRRASSIVQFEKHNIGRLSIASALSDMVLGEDEAGDGDGDYGDDSKNKTTADAAMQLRKNRRVSFIQTGKVE